MLTKTYEAIGTTEDGTTIVLETPLPIRGRVKVQIVAPTPEQPESSRKDLWSFLDEIHARQRARGHVPMTPEEVEAYIRESRAERDDEENLP